MMVFYRVMFSTHDSEWNPSCNPSRISQMWKYIPTQIQQSKERYAYTNVPPWWLSWESVRLKILTSPVWSRVVAFNFELFLSVSCCISAMIYIWRHHQDWKCWIYYLLDRRFNQLSLLCLVLRSGLTTNRGKIASQKRRCCFLVFFRWI